MGMQVADPTFFVRMIPMLDGGDDVGMVLSPQCFWNLNQGGDIFNHTNIHFWEYMQPGRLLLLLPNLRSRMRAVPPADCLWVCQSDGPCASWCVRTLIALWPPAGYDALGFISCTGERNLLLHSSPFKDARAQALLTVAFYLAG